MLNKTINCRGFNEKLAIKGLREPSPFKWREIIRAAKEQCCSPEAHLTNEKKNSLAQNEFN